MFSRPASARPPRDLQGAKPLLMAAAIARLRALPLFAVLSAAVLLVAALGAIDYFSEANLSFLVFYLVPVFLVTLRAGLWPGVFASVGATAIWFLANINQFDPRVDAIIPYWNLAETLGVFVFFTYILTALVASIDQEREGARFDSLTRVANRGYFHEVLDREIVRSRRYRRTFTLVYMDIDNFKALNDSQGHAAGDALLRTVADILLRGTRHVDTPARLGGDEFALLLPETGYDASRAFLLHLQAQLDEAMKRTGRAVTVTMGAVTYASPIHSAEEMIGKTGVSHHVVEGPTAGNA
jgi:diguanylate cyclase (GGDEF)-like protein